MGWPYYFLLHSYTDEERGEHQRRRGTGGIPTCCRWLNTTTRGWTCAPNFYVNGKDACVRKVCDKDFCECYGRGFREPERIEGDWFPRVAVEVH